MIWLNDHEIKPTIFPDGTSQVWKIPEKVFKDRHPLEQHIHWEFQNEAEFIHLAQLCDLIEARGMEIDCLYIPYFPYARQDKEVSNNTTFAKKTFVKLLETLPAVKGIMTDDVHSLVFHPRKTSSNDPYMDILNTRSCIGANLICFPDNGAKERYSHFNYFKPNRYQYFETCSFTKVRNQDTGRIERLDLNELTDVENRVILIVDDLCDGGMTFKLTAERLYELGAKEVHLYTTHGIYSKGLETLRESGIKRIFNRKGEVE